jgi:transcription initiation factor TFIIB
MVACAALYAACRQEGVPRTLTEISRHSRYSRKEISRTYQVMVKALKMHSMPPLPEDYLPRICSKLDLTPKVEGTARDLLRAAQDVPLTNSVPISLAAASVYIASIINNERRKQKDVARANQLLELRRPRFLVYLGVSLPRPLIQSLKYGSLDPRRSQSPLLLPCFESS